MLLLCISIIILGCESTPLQYGNDIAYNTTNQAVGDTLYGIDENKNTATVTTFHNRWANDRTLKWTFNCGSIQNLKNRGMNVLYYNRNFGQYDLSFKQGYEFCNIMENIITEAFDEWIRPISHLMSHEKSNDANAVKMSFKNQNSFDQTSTLAHANQVMLEINTNFDWIILSAKNPTYFLFYDRGFRYEYGMFYKMSQSLYYSYINSRYINLYTVILHEIGHVFGLLHSNSPNSIMYPTSLYPINWVKPVDVSFIAQFIK